MLPPSNDPQTIAWANLPVRAVSAALCGALLCVVLIEAILVYELRGPHRILLTVTLGTAVFLALVAYVVRGTQRDRRASTDAEAEAAYAHVRGFPPLLPHRPHAAAPTAICVRNVL